MKGLIVCASILCVYGELVPVVPLDPLPPINIAPDGSGHNNPVITEGVQEKKLLGTPDEHDQNKNIDKPLLGAPDGHDNQENSEKPLLGKPDGHDFREPLIGQNDGHEDISSKEEQDSAQSNENMDKPLIGGSDGHDFRKPLIGGQDGHEINEDMKSKEKESADSSSEEFGHETDYNTGEDYDLDDDLDDDLIDRIMDDEDEYSYDEYDDDKDGEQPLVRCSRPLCDQYCFMGFQTDDRGCPLCDCLVDPCLTLKCNAGQVCRINECTSDRNCKQLTADCVEDVPSCAMPMCANYCEHGYHYDERGCMSCECEPAPASVAPEANSTHKPPRYLDCPQIECPGIENAPCLYGAALDENGCVTCGCKEAPKETPKQTKFSCAEPMCATKCELGYMRNEYGCMTCDCATSEKTCGPDRCEKDEKCVSSYDSHETGSVPETCVPKPLCESLREGLVVDRLAALNAPRCDEETGKFLPLQCDRLESECWCVDDRGVVIDGTRTSVYVDEHKPRCERNITVAVTVRMLLATVAARHPSYEGQYNVSELISRDLPVGLSYCTLINRGFISVNKVESIDVVTSDVGSQYYVELLVRNDGLVDLPAAMLRMKRRSQTGRCMIAIENGAVLEPAPDSLTIEHKFSLLPKPLVTDPDTGMYVEDVSWLDYYRNNTYILMFIILLAVLVVVCALLVIVHIVRTRRRMGQMNFQHQRLESQISTYSEKSLLEGRDDNVLLINNGPIEEKMAMRA